MRVVQVLQVAYTTGYSHCFYVGYGNSRAKARLLLSFECGAGIASPNRARGPRTEKDGLPPSVACKVLSTNKTDSVALSPQANYTD
jgi:hypothetical protein